MLLRCDSCKYTNRNTKGRYVNNDAESHWYYCIDCKKLYCYACVGKEHGEGHNHSLGKVILNSSWGVQHTFRYILLLLVIFLLIRSVGEDTDGTHLKGFIPNRHCPKTSFLKPKTFGLLFDNMIKQTIASICNAEDSLWRAISSPLFSVAHISVTLVKESGTVLALVYWLLSTTISYVAAVPLSVVYLLESSVVVSPQIVNVLDRIEGSIYWVSMPFTIASRTLIYLFKRYALVTMPPPNHLFRSNKLKSLSPMISILASDFRHCMLSTVINLIWCFLVFRIFDLVSASQLTVATFPHITFMSSVMPDFSNPSVFTGTWCSILGILYLISFLAVPARRSREPSITS